MCGIFGYVGKRSDAARIVFEGLKILEYRGYDSWGVVVREKGKRKKEKLIVEKHIGKIGDARLSIVNRPASIALGHTRWATHGGVTAANAHPHLDCVGKIAIVHNGIVENYLDLKKKLTKKHHFKSETDTEVVVHLVEELLENNSFAGAIRKAFNLVSGLNAFIFVGMDGEIMAVKSGSPLVVGFGKEGNFIASDSAAISGYCPKAVFMEDGEMTEFTSEEVRFTSAANGKEIKPKFSVLSAKKEGATLGKFKHYMIKEIYEQPQVLKRIIANGEGIERLANEVKKAHGTFFIGCGTASYAALSGAYLFSKIAKKHVNFSIGSEFQYLEDYLGPDSLVFAISQSGETIDIVEPVGGAKKRGAKIVALTNVEGSTLFRMSDFQVQLLAGPERAVCATKSFSAMVAILVLLSYAVVGKISYGKKIIDTARKAVTEVLKQEYISNIKKLAGVLASEEDIYVIGRGLSYPVALEATLKLKEVPYIHSEGFAGGELKHGVIALIEKGTPCIVFAPDDETYNSIISNAIEIKSRGGFIIGISPKNNDVFDFYLPVADAKEASIIPSIVPVQLLAYFLALEKRLDPDMPRNLAKSVTVK